MMQWDLQHPFGAIGSKGGKGENTTFGAFW